MQSIIQDTIATGRFDLNDLSRKINRLYIEGHLTDEQRDTLLSQAREKADPHQSYGTWQAAMDGVMQTVRALEERITALEAGTPQAPTDDEWPPYKQPTGAHDAYQTGDKMTYTDGKRYISNRDGNVWPPDVLPSAWTVQP